MQQKTDFPGPRPSDAMDRPPMVGTSLPDCIGIQSNYTVIGHNCQPEQEAQVRRHALRLAAKCVICALLQYSEARSRTAGLISRSG